MNNYLPIKSLQEELEECRIHPFVEIEVSPALLSIGEKAIFTRGNISTILGEPKCGKTMILSYLTAAYLQPEVLDKEFVADSKHPVILYFDTEQSSYHSKKCLERIYSLINDNVERQNLHVFALRDKDNFRRLELIKQGIHSYPDVSLILIDGIIDLVNSYNDEGQASFISQELMKLSKLYNCHICTVIHVNKGSKEAKGHLGAYLKQKSENVFYVEKNGETIHFKTQASRDVATPDLSFKIDSSGIPNLIN
jgi:predicted ATP-dependent serine protease